MTNNELRETCESILNDPAWEADAIRYQVRKRKREEYEEMRLKGIEPTDEFLKSLQTAHDNWCLR